MQEKDNGKALNSWWYIHQPKFNLKDRKRLRKADLQVTEKKKHHQGVQLVCTQQEALCKMEGDFYPNSCLKAGGVAYTIEKRALNPSEKILYLLQYLTGALRKVVEGYHSVSTLDAYQGHRRKTIQSSICCCCLSKKVGKLAEDCHEGTALRKFTDFVQTCKLAMHLVEDPEKLKMKLVKMLPWGHLE